MTAILQMISEAAVPSILALVGLSMLFSRKPTVDFFLEGAREGLQTTVRLLPTLLLLIVGISMFMASGAADAIAEWVSPLLVPLGVPKELLVFLLVRPFSGSASTAMAAELFERYGADSLTGTALSLILATSDTTVYVIGVYMAACGVKKTRHTFPAALLALLFSVFFCCAAARLLMGEGGLF